MGFRSWDVKAPGNRRLTKLPQPLGWGPTENAACCGETKSRPAEMLECSLLEGPFTLTFSCRTTRDCGQGESNPEKPAPYPPPPSLPPPDTYSLIVVSFSAILF